MKESVSERAERQYRERMAFYDHLAARTQAARDLIARERLFHVVRVNDRTGAKVPLTTSPEPHDRACTILSKCAKWPQYPELRTVLEEAETTP